MYAANVIDMPFEENFFGGGCAFATFEHWKEKGGNQIDGIKEIHRVLKPGGWFIVDCPIHEHGAEEFISDDIDKILSYIDTDSWNIETEEWRKDYDPLPPYEAWYYKGKTLENIKEAAFTHSKQKVPSAWLFTILLEKK
ncbi:methyltransferase domain-containing protein [Candidatus Pacearchaeota archaeon]|nr:methyltransferase domain-containing protein [Candidatus Pacearchaeota archaeon]